jgi:uncharacterized protein YodC (DUF2158 family)
MATEAKFAVGDVVVLKSGGPDMTVRTVDESTWSDNLTRITTNWFDEKDTLHTDNFTEDSLELVDDPEERAKDELLLTIPVLMNMVSQLFSGQDIVVPAEPEKDDGYQPGDNPNWGTL